MLCLSENPFPNQAVKQLSLSSDHAAAQIGEVLQVTIDPIECGANSTQEAAERLTARNHSATHHMRSGPPGASRRFRLTEFVARQSNLAAERSWPMTCGRALMWGGGD
jgi:hypothetical protein